MIDTRDNGWCSGCGACESACPVSAISMEADAAGFKYPRIDTAACIDCGRCEKVCPVKNCSAAPEKVVGYLGQSKDEAILRESATGGVFTALARDFLRAGGMVAGAAYDEDLVVRHVICEREEDLFRLSGSKYVQSDLGDIFSQVEALMGEGRKVLFSGTPCQVAGLKSFLGNRGRGQLFTIDFLCHNVAAPRALEVYLENKGRQYGSRIRKIRFKDKKYGYSFPTFAVTAGEGTRYHTSQSDEYMTAFLGRRISRESCFTCPFRRHKYSDITLADHYIMDEAAKGFRKNAGLNRVMVHTKEGLALLKNATDIRFRRLPEDYPCVSESERSDVERPRSFIDFELLPVLGSGDFFREYFHVGRIARAKGLARFLLYKAGVHDLIKKMVKGHR